MDIMNGEKLSSILLGSNMELIYESQFVSRRGRDGVKRLKGKSLF